VTSSRNNASWLPLAAFEADIYNGGDRKIILPMSKPLTHQASSRAAASLGLRYLLVARLQFGIILAVFAAIATISLNAETKKPRLTLDEFFNAVDFTKVALSPDGHMVVVATDRADWKNDRFRQDLWLWRNSDGALIPLTQSGHDSDPKWSSDGKWVAFVSDRANDGDDSDKSDSDSTGVTHVYVIPISGGEAFPVTRGAEDVHSFAWSSDSKSIYFATRIPRTRKQKEDYEEKWKDVIRYREQERGDVISRIAVAEALKRQVEIGTQEKKKSKKDKKKDNDSDEETGETPGSEAIVTSSYRVKSMAVSPDGTQIAYSTDSISQRFEGLKEVEIYVADTTKAGPQNVARQLTSNEALEDEVQWSPDGRSVFFTVEQGSVEAKYADLQPRVYSVDAASGKPSRWASDFDGSISHYAVQPNGAMLAPGMLGTATALYQQTSPQQSIRKLEGWPGTYAHVATSLNSPRIAFTYSEVDKPTEVYIAESADSLSSAKAITSLNRLFTERDLPKGKPFRWTSDDGTSVEGMLLYPPGKFEAKNLRLFVLVHGGPTDADGNYFGADWYNWGMYAACQGWLVFRPNYRGSAGYGDKFALAIVPKIVSVPGRDILTGVDALVKAGIANPNQMTIGGYSYGGYMTNWLITQTDEFKAAVTGAGAVEHVGNWGNDDTTYDDAFFLGGLPWDPKARQNYIDEAAIFRFDKVKTPTHISAGEDDIRVAVAEDYLLEHALHVLDIPNSLLLFPNEGHELSENPWHGKIKVREEVDWIEKYCACPAK
jgi:dipeptidyl aminopeptidase/acylaminoacyl peptidase